MNYRRIYLGLGGLLATALAVFLLVSNSTTAASVDAVKKAALSGVTAGDPKAGCPHGDMAKMESYVFKGVVKNVNVDKKRVTLQHEKIGDYMEAMTMPFTVHDAALLSGLEPGATRWFVLHVMEDRAMIVAVAESQEAAEKLMASSNVSHGAHEGHATKAASGKSGHEGHEGGACCGKHASTGEKAGSHAGCGGH